jgi:electron transfer flavoprotein alpha subunit
MSEVWAYSESQGLRLEIAGAAKSLTEESGGTPFLVNLAGKEEPEESPLPLLTVQSAGASLRSTEARAEALARAARARTPSLILVGATREGREVASRLAVKLKVPCLSDVANLRLAERLVGERTVSGGRVIAIVSAGLPCVATVKAGAYRPETGGSQQVASMEVGEVAESSRLLETRNKEQGKVDLTHAKVIVSAGRGFKKKEDLALAESLAEELHGALGCSRPLSSDYGWLPEEHHIGLTGVNVKPDLYLALGISGQLQHIAGIRDAKMIVAVNTDKDAPIFQAADYGVVGDLYKFIPAMVERLKKGV